MNTTTQTAHTANQMGTAIGLPVQLRSGELWIDCIVADVKNSWGKNRLLVRPVAGSGEQWVEMSSVRLATSRAAQNDLMGTAR